MKRIILVSLLFVVVCSARAQMFIPTVKKIRLCEVAIDKGIQIEWDNVGLTLGDFKKLSPNSSLLNKDYSNFSEDNWSSSDVNRQLSLQAGFQLRNKKTMSYRKSTLQLGFSYFSGISFDLETSGFSKIRFDTLHNGGNTIYYDSTFDSYLSSYYNYGQFRFDASWIFNYKPQYQIFIFYGGEISLGISTDTHIENDYSSSIDIQLTDSAIGTYNYLNQNTIPYQDGDVYSVKNNFTACLSAPIGIDIKLGMQNNFFKHLHVFAEARPGIAMTIFPKVVTLKYKCFQDGVGIKYSW